MTWPREQGHISRTKGHRPLKFSENFTKGLKAAIAKIRSPALKTGGTEHKTYLGGGIHPPLMCGRGLTLRNVHVVQKYMPGSMESSLTRARTYYLPILTKHHLTYNVITQWSRYQFWFFFCFFWKHDVGVADCSIRWYLKLHCDPLFYYTFFRKIYWYWKHR